MTALVQLHAPGFGWREWVQYSGSYNNSCDAGISKTWHFSPFVNNFSVLHLGADSTHTMYVVLSWLRAAGRATFGFTRRSGALTCTICRAGFVRHTLLSIAWVANFFPIQPRSNLIRKILGHLFSWKYEIDFFPIPAVVHRPITEPEANLIFLFSSFYFVHTRPDRWPDCEEWIAWLICTTGKESILWNSEHPTAIIDRVFGQGFHGRGQNMMFNLLLVIFLIILWGPNRWSREFPRVATRHVRVMLCGTLNHAQNKLWAKVRRGNAAGWYYKTPTINYVCWRGWARRAHILASSSNFHRCDRTTHGYCCYRDVNQLEATSYWVVNTYFTLGMNSSITKSVHISSREAGISPRCGPTVYGYYCRLLIDADQSGATWFE